MMRCRLSYCLFLLVTLITLGIIVSLVIITP